MPCFAFFHIIFSPRLSDFGRAPAMPSFPRPRKIEPGPTCAKQLPDFFIGHFLGAMMRRKQGQAGSMLFCFYAAARLHVQNIFFFSLPPGFASFGKNAGALRRLSYIACPISSLDVTDADAGFAIALRRFRARPSRHAAGRTASLLPPLGHFHLHHGHSCCLSSQIRPILAVIALASRCHDYRVMRAPRAGKHAELLSALITTA